MAEFSPLSLAVGAQSSSTVFAPHVGTLRRASLDGGVTYKWYRIAKAGAALLVNGVVTTAYTAGVPTFTVAHSIVVDDPDVVGVVPSVYTSGITSGNYFWVQVSGGCTFIAGDTVVLRSTGEYRLVTYSVASGQVRAVSTFTTASTSDTEFFGYATNSSVATAIGQTIVGILKGLVDKW